MVLNDLSIFKLIANGNIKHVNSADVSPASLDLVIDQVEKQSDNSWLVSTLDEFNLPADIAGLIIPKSSATRKGFNVLAGWIDPGYSGTLTCRVTRDANCAKEPKQGDRLFQVVFFELNNPARNTYDNTHHYQGMKGITKHYED